MAHASNHSQLGEDLSRFLFEESHDGLILFEPQSLRLLEANPSAQSITGRPRQDLIDSPLDALFEGSTSLDQLLQACHVPRHFASQHLSLKQPDQTLATVTSVVHPIHSECGTQGLIVLRALAESQAENRELSTIVDDTASRTRRDLHTRLNERADPLAGHGTTDRQVRELEQALRNSELRYRSLIQNAPLCIHELDVNGAVISMNSVGLRIIEAPNETDVLGVPYLQFVEETDRAKVAKLLKKAVGGQAVAYDFLGIVNGNRRTFSSNLIPIFDAAGSVTKLMGVSEDITLRRETERKLRESEASLAKAQKIARLGNWELDVGTGELTGSTETYRILGIAEQEHVPHQLISAIENYIHPDDRDIIFSAVEQAVATGQPKPLEFRRVSSPSGEIRHLRADAEMIQNSDGSFAGMFGTLQDITEQKEAEFALRESENKFRVIAENCPAMVAIFQDGKFEYANDMVSVITGYSKQEAANLGFLEMVDPEYRDLVRSRHQSRLRGEKVPSRYEFKLRTKSGSLCWIDFTASLIEYNGKTAVLGIALDVTERRLTEEQLRQREIELAHVSRLTTMGEMVAGIAHEINQPLSAISSFADACTIELEKLDDSSVAAIQEWTKQIGQQAVRCGDIIRRLRSYVRRKKLDETSIRINDVIQESIALFSNEFRRSVIDVECDLADPSPMVPGNSVELQQVIVNLLANANEAMKQSDTGQNKISVSLSRTDRIVRIDVEDTGPGIKPGNLEHLFKAFFTTKPDGMGMGLAISRSIIERHNGRLWAENRSPHGAAFHAELPLAST